MDVMIDHYSVLGLESGEEGAKHSEEVIKSAYRHMALEKHPDKKKPDDPNPNCPAEFHKLKSSYEFLLDKEKRKSFDDLLRVNREQQSCHLQSDAKRPKTVPYPEEMEQAYDFAAYQATKEAEKREIVARKLQEQIESIKNREMPKRKKHQENIARINFHAMLANKGTFGASVPLKREVAGMRKEAVVKENVLNVFWEKGGVDYNKEELRQVFSQFGQVEDVLIKSYKKRSVALVEMASTYAAVAATKSLCRDLLNPLPILPVRTGIPTKISRTEKTAEPNKDFVLKKLQKAAENNKNSERPPRVSIFTDHELPKFQSKGNQLAALSIEVLSNQLQTIFGWVSRRGNSEAGLLAKKGVTLEEL